MSKKIAVLVGSLREGSFNKKIAKELVRLAPEGLELSLVEIGSLPFYNEDLETENAPKAWKDFRETLKNSAGLIFVTPEYNRSIPAVLKNAIDVASRPKGESALSGKPAGVISVSIGRFGGFAANQHLRQTLVTLNLPVMQQPESYLGNAEKLFGEDGKTATEATETSLKKFLTKFADWAEKF